MKKILVFFSALAMMFAACTQDQTSSVEAKLPEIVYANVAAGDIYELSFTASLPWTLSMSQEAMAYFYFLESEDSTSATYSLRGEAGDHVVKVKVADIQEYEVRVCDITLAMGNLKGVICRLSRTGLSRDMAIYMAQGYDTESDDFSKDADGNYLYGADDITELTLHYDEYNNVYKQRIKIDASCVWDLVEKPNWLRCDVTSATEIGKTEISILSDLEKLPYQTEKRNLVFYDCSDPQNRVPLRTISVTIDGCEDYLKVSLPKNMLFNEKGLYNNDGELSEMGAIGSLNAPKGAKIYKVSKNGELYDASEEATSWILLQNDKWDDEDSDVTNASGAYDASYEAGIWSRRFNVLTTENMGLSEREGMLIILPQSLAKSVTNPSIDLFNGDKTEVKEIYAAYAYNIAQDSEFVSKGMFTIHKLTDTMAEMGAELTSINDDDPNLSWTYGEAGKCESAYQLLYTRDYSSLGYYLNPNFEYDKVVYMAWNASGANYSTVTPDKSWLSYNYIETEDGNNGYRVAMDKTKAQLNADSGAYEGFIVFKKNNKVVTFLYCVYNENATIGGEADENLGETTFVDEVVASQHGVTLTKIDSTEADYDKKLGNDYGISDVSHQYRMTYNSREALAQPQYAALNIVGFSYGQAVGTYEYYVEGNEDKDGDGKLDMIAKTGYYSQMITVEKSAELGGVVIYPNSENGFAPETLPAGEYTLLMYGSSSVPIARIVLEIVDTETK